MGIDPLPSLARTRVDSPAVLYVIVVGLLDWRIRFGIFNKPKQKF